MVDYEKDFDSEVAKHIKQVLFTDTQTARGVTVTVVE